jgi:hypothetical protein
MHWRDAERRTRDARAPHFTHKLEKIYPDMVQIGLEQEATPTRREQAEGREMLFSCTEKSLLPLCAPVKTSCLAFARRPPSLRFAATRARCLASAVILVR